MSFPNSVNPQALRQIVRFVTQQDTDKGRLALAGYEVEGYALNLVYPGAAYIQDGMVTACPCPDANDPVVKALQKEFDAAPKQGVIDWTAILAEMKTVLGPLVLQILTNILLKP